MLDSKNKAWNARAWMVEIIRNKYGLNSPKVLEAMLEVPRENFVLEADHDQAYEDRPLPIGYGQTISQPLTVAYMLDLLKVNPNDNVLEVGTGLGYEAAVLALLAKTVFTVEVVPQLATEAEKRLKAYHFDNVSVKEGSGVIGWSDHAPYDKIIIAADVDSEVPQELFNQLKNGGILVAPIKGVMTRFTKKYGMPERETFESFKFVPFIMKS